MLFRSLTGIRPMPGITSMNSRTLDYKGFLKETTVNFVCHNLEQLEALEQLYMRPGYTVMVEWGWSQYFDNSSNLITMPVYLDLFDQITNYVDIDKLLKKIQDRRKLHAGNYDACLGKITQYNWTLLKNGSYDCSVTITGHGELMQSLKINTINQTTAASNIIINDKIGRAHV